MQEWKKKIFIRIIHIRTAVEGKKANEIIDEYVALSEEEKAEILEAIEEDKNP